MPESKNEKEKTPSPKYYQKSIKDVESSFSTSLRSGLSESEVKKRLEKVGLNQLEEAQKRTV